MADKSFGILIEYELSGDEAAWRQAVDTFVANIDADPRLQGRFSYIVTARGEEGGRVHVGQWDAEETLAHLQSQPWFKDFSQAVQTSAGDGLKASRFTHVAGTK